MPVYQLATRDLPIQLFTAATMLGLAISPLVVPATRSIYHSIIIRPTAGTGIVSGSIVAESSRSIAAALNGDWFPWGPAVSLAGLGVALGSGVEIKYTGKLYAVRLRMTVAMPSGEGNLSAWYVGGC